jgi:hypothetical protein
MLSLVAACASSPQTTTTQALSSSADAPYDKVLVVALFEAFDARRYLEKEIIAQLADRGVEGIAMTSMSDSRTIINRDTVVDRVQKTGADAVLVTQLVSYEAEGEIKGARPEATYNFRPTYWYNVFEVELTEYTEPDYTQFTNQIALATDVFSAQTQQKVWSMSSDWEIKEGLQPGRDYTAFVGEAKSIVDAAARAKVIGR